MIKNIKLGLISGICALTVTACAPSYQMSADEQAGYGYGYNDAQYGYDYVSGQSQYGCGQPQYGCDQSQYDYGYGQSAYNTYGYDQAAYGYGASQNIATYASRYGGELRGGHQLRGGMMSVVPVYPVYQVYAPPAAQPADIEIFETPTITLPDPEPVVTYEPEPIYEAPVYEPIMEAWPEVDTPITTWAPLRK